MARICDVCGKGPAVGHKISHAHNVTKRRWLPNLVSLRAMVKGRPQRMRVCTRCLKAGMGVKVFSAGRKKRAGGGATPRRTLTLGF